MRHFFTLFVLVSLAEVMVFIEVGELLGVGLTIISVIATAAIGVSLLRIQGLKTLQKVQQKMAVGEVPGQEMIEGVLLLIAAALLLTPGFLTDGTGFLLLAPLSRAQIARWLLAKGILEGSQWMVKSQMSGSSPFGAQFGQQNPFYQQNGPAQSAQNPFSQGVDGFSSQADDTSQRAEGSSQRANGFSHQADGSSHQADGSSQNTIDGEFQRKE